MGLGEGLVTEVAPKWPAGREARLRGLGSGGVVDGCCLQARFMVLNALIV
jgi:hypothetical protein